MAFAPGVNPDNTPSTGRVHPIRPPRTDLPSASAGFGSRSIRLVLGLSGLELHWSRCYSPPSMGSRKGFVEIIGVPVDLGAGRRGVDMGPSAIRIADLEPRLEQLGHKVLDSGDIDVMIPETQKVG